MEADEELDTSAFTQCMENLRDFVMKLMINSDVIYITDYFMIYFDIFPHLRGK